MNMNKLAAALVALVTAGGAASAQPDPTSAHRPQTADTAARSENAQLLAEIMRQLYGCWHPPRGANASATLRFTLNRNGTLADGPTLIKFTVGRHSQGVVDTAMRAVRECTLHLPAASYEFWREVEASFDAGPD